MSPAPKISQHGVPSAVSRVLHSGRVWIIQGVGTLVWLALAYAGFRMGKASAWRLAGSALLACFLAYLAVFLQRTALRVYRRERLGDARLGSQESKDRRRRILEWFPHAALVIILFAALVWIYDVIRDTLPCALDHAASWLTAQLGRPVDFRVLEARAISLEIVLVWLMFVLFWLPLAAAALLGEISLWRAAKRAWRSLRYWLGTLASFVIGYLAVWEFSGRALQEYGNGGQAVTLVAGLALGYAVALGAWLVILALAEESIATGGPRSVDDTWD